MKQALLIVNALLVIAVTYLLYKQFTGGSEKVVTAGSALKTKDTTQGEKNCYLRT
ncbi:hypothetical protein LWM68_35430 [Niabella sp. W65]|nr:hypothetical protein [Niabella sp. W65]MCH7367588.1 hypothetical protein [Niabella sp. W65]